MLIQSGYLDNGSVWTVHVRRFPPYLADHEIAL